MGDHERQGMFSVNLSVVDGEIRAVLTGDHFLPCETEVASVISETGLGEAMILEMSPAYLVRDSVVGLAVECAERCESDKGEAFTRVVMNSVELPEGDLSDRLREAVSSVVGMTCVDAPWNGAMSSDEVEDTMTRACDMGVCMPWGKDGEKDMNHIDAKFQGSEGCDNDL